MESAQQLKAELKRLVALTPKADKIASIQSAVAFKEAHKKAAKAVAARSPTIAALQSAIAELRLYVG